MIELVFCKTFGADFQTQIPVIIGGSEHTEVIEPASTTAELSTHAAVSGENIVKIYSDVAIYAAIGEAPTASVPAAGESVDGVFPVKADVPEERYIQPGHKVSVIVA